MVLANPTYILKQRSIGATSEMHLFPAKVGTKYQRGLSGQKPKHAAFLHERRNYSHVTSSNWTRPSVKLMLSF
jgi:hypothetical protein